MNIYWEAGLIQNIWNDVQSAKVRKVCTVLMGEGGAQQKNPTSDKDKQQI